MRKNRLQIFLLMALASFAGCGGSTETDTEETPSTSDTVNTAKLVGTPFEGKTTGDDFDWEFFLCNQYRTEIIDTLPIKIFAAFFTESEEATIQAGIDVANEAMGPTSNGGVFYEWTDTWADDVRVVYKVENSVNEETGIDYEFDGHTRNVESRFDNKLYAETQMPDWQIQILENGINKWVIAHELGHASGIAGHYLIDYINDTFTDLEEDSLMSPGHSRTDPALTNYTYMMQQQAQIMQDHFQELDYNKHGIVSRLDSGQDVAF